MNKTLTAPQTNDDPAWDARPFSLTLAGCLHLAGMPLASQAVAEVLPKTTAEMMNDPNRVPAPASCRVCQMANLYGCLSCREENCPNPLPESESGQTAPLDAGTCCIECLEQSDAKHSPTGEPFHIEDESAANWYLRKLAGIETEKQRITTQTEKMLAELEADAAGLKFLYQNELETFVKTELARKGGRRKTLHLLQGTCAFRSVPASVKVSDPLAALEYAKQNGLPCIVISKRLDAEEYKKLAEGKLLPGMDSTPQREAFSVKFGDKE